MHLTHVIGKWDTQLLEWCAYAKEKSMLKQLLFHLLTEFVKVVIVQKHTVPASHWQQGLLDSESLLFSY